MPVHQILGEGERQFDYAYSDDYDL
jgi:hypothetical protein